MFNSSDKTTISLIAMCLHTTLLLLRNLLHMLPYCVRRFIVRTTLYSPLWLSRLVMNFGTRPVGDESKWIHKIEQNTWKGVWIVPDLDSLEQAECDALSNDLVVLYAHGGGYCKGNSTMYMETFQLIINHLRIEHNIRASILSLEYSLSPEHVWPKACDEAMEAYQYLTSTIGIPSSKIIFAGDSAGGNLLAVTLLTIKSEKHQLHPAGAALFSPWVDLSINQSRLEEKYVGHYVPNYKNLSEAARLSVTQNPQISPIYGDFSSTCPMFLSYGENELLRTSIENFKLKLEKDAVDVTTLIGKDARHVWLVYSLIATSGETFEKDCKVFIDWMASIVTVSSNVAKCQSTDVTEVAMTSISLK
ncbi:esterase-like [Bradysia coprophila]|uniref:esterase-like n=1 Tax=Bradysia coprophila TaxID=38358 RepID=UPI00187DCC76|nr:esterase-like [Bradysia coprophila]